MKKEYKTILTFSKPKDVSEEEINNVICDALEKLGIMLDDPIGLQINIDPDWCPYCGSYNTDEKDCMYYLGGYGEKHICHDCGQDYIVWYKDSDDDPYDITDRHNQSLLED